MQNEAASEQKFLDFVKRYRGKYYKLIATESGMPDRLLIMPYGFSYLIEWKKLDGSGTVSKIQKYQHDRLSELGHRVWVIEYETDLLNFKYRVLTDYESEWKKTHKSGK